MRSVSDEVTGPARASAEWLALREPADAAARSPDLVEAIRTTIASGHGSRIHDLGCGTGSMARWLAARVAGPQQWFLYDRDAELLDLIGAHPPEAADSSPVTVETRRRDITRLDSGELVGASLITASALLDMMTPEEVRRLVATCVATGCPALITLTVTGSVALQPSHVLDQQVTEAFNAHQRRFLAGGRLLGPDAVGVTAEEFTRRGWHVVLRPSPWRLGASDRDLTAAWFTGWLAAACEQDPELIGETRSYARRRLAEAAAGHLLVTLEHQDLLARAPAPTSPADAAVSGITTLPGRHD